MPMLLLFDADHDILNPIDVDEDDANKILCVNVSITMLDDDDYYYDVSFNVHTMKVKTSNAF